MTLPHRRTNDGATQPVGDKDADSMSLEDVLDLSAKRLPLKPDTALQWEIWSAYCVLGIPLPEPTPEDQAKIANSRLEREKTLHKRKLAAIRAKRYREGKKRLNP